VGIRVPAPTEPLAAQAHFSARDLGLPEHTVFRCFQALPSGQMAIGADYGLALVSGEKVNAFPFPKGARKESMDVQSLAFDGHSLHVVTTKNAYAWDLKQSVRAKPFPRDNDGGFEELRVVAMGPNGLIEAWREHWVCDGQSHPGEDILSIASNSEVAYYGTRGGQLGIFSGPILHRFIDDGHACPIRHLAWAHQRLWIAAAGAIYTYQGEQLTKVRDGEPFGFCVDPQGRLWSLDPQGVSLSNDTGELRRLQLKIERPWSIGADAQGLWIGQRGGISRWSWAPTPS